MPYMTPPARPVAFSTPESDFCAFPEHGAFFGYMTSTYVDVLLVVAMRVDGSPDLLAGEPNIGEVSCVEDDDTCLEAVNATFGTTFTRDQFPGR